MTNVRGGLQLVVGVLDYAAETARRAPGVGEWTRGSMLHRVRRLEPAVRRNATELAGVSEQAAAGVRRRAREITAAVGGFASGAERNLNRLRDRLNGSFGQIFAPRDRRRTGGDQAAA